MAVTCMVEQEFDFDFFNFKVTDEADKKPLP